ncbi:MAG TPA: DMT family transporter [Candidatus Saccharimonadales bacterium]|nr:DMT family transporter [Candidatus Saccharimonadales bacterium]
MKYIKFGSVALILAALLFSVDGLLRRHLYTLPPSIIVFYEHLFGLIILAPFALKSFKSFKELTRKQWYAITGVAFLSGAVGTILYTAALGRINFIDFSVVVLLQQLNPVFAITAAALLLREPLSRRFMGLAVISLVAAYFVTFPSLSVNLSTGSGTVIAALYAVGAAAAWGSSTAFSKYALKDTSTLHITALRFGITPFFALGFVFLSGSAASLGSITFSQFKYLVAITFSTGMVALLIYYFGLKRVLASRAALLELAWPLSAVIVGYIWLEQGLTLTQGIGALVLTGSIYLIAKDANKLALAKQTAKTK